MVHIKTIKIWYGRQKVMQPHTHKPRWPLPPVFPPPSTPMPPPRPPCLPSSPPPPLLLHHHHHHPSLPCFTTKGQGAWNFGSFSSTKIWNSSFIFWTLSRLSLISLANINTNPQIKVTLLASSQNHFLVLPLK